MKRNIGVITWFSGPNYGTNLQAIALQKVLRKLGYNSELINFTPPEILKKKELSEKLKIFFSNQIVKIKNIIIKKRYGTLIIDRNKKMLKSLENNCIFSSYIDSEKKFIDICNSYDILIFGSDQIWNPNWFHPFYYGDYEEIKTQRIAYAPSIGVTKIGKELSSKYKNALERFKDIAIREDSGIILLNNIIKKDILKVVDPTFLLTSFDWDKIFELNNNCNEEYILCYLLTDNKNHIKAVYNFVHKHKLKLKIIPYQKDTYFMKGEVIANAGSKDFLQLIKNAKYVITDSFHGLVFSLIYQKQFYILTRFNDDKKESQNSRIYQLINEYKISSRLQKYNTNIIKEEKDINYTIVNKKLEIQKNISINYLKNSLRRNWK